MNLDGLDAYLTFRRQHHLDALRRMVEVNSFTTNLQAKAASADRKEGGSAPALGSSATGDAFTVASAKDEAALEQRRNDRYTFGRAKDFLGDALIGCPLNLVQNGTSGLDTLGRLGVFISCEESGDR